MARFPHAAQTAHNDIEAHDDIEAQALYRDCHREVVQFTLL